MGIIVVGKYLLVLSVLCTISLSNGADLEQGEALRSKGDLSGAERALSRYSAVANFDTLKPNEKTDFFRGVLELAHVRALRKDVPGSLSLLNWAEARPDEYQRGLAYLKYAQILIDLEEPERASGYLKNADELIARKSLDDETGAAIGQGSEAIDVNAPWRDLRDESDALKSSLEAAEMRKSFGATYANYVKLRRLQVIAKRSVNPRYGDEAMKLADELIATDPKSQFAAAAGYLKGEILAARLTEDSPKKEIKDAKEYLEKFIKQHPDGLYRGEALMLLGKISLEIEWNAKDAEKDYAQALDYFRKAREKRDALSLYGTMNDDLKKQVEPTQKTTSLNQWKNIIYLEEDPLKLYNGASAPPWYINDKEKNCCLWMGFIALSDGNANRAKEYWSNVQLLDETSGSENAPYPDLMKRLMSACRFNMFILSSDELASVKDRNMRLRLNYASMYYMMGRFSEAEKIFTAIFKSTNDDTVKSLCMLCIGGILHVDVQKKEMAMKCFDWIIKNKKLKGSLNYGSAVYRYANALMGLPDGFNQALPMYREYLNEYKKNNRWDYYRDAGYKEIFCLILQKNFAEAKKRFEIYKKEKNDSFVKALEYKFKIIEEKGVYE